MRNQPVNYTITSCFRAVPILSLFFLASMTGCATTSFPVMGIRPDYPNLSPSPEVVEWCKSLADGAKPSCLMYRNYHEYANTLSASYRSRATLNEWALYFAGLVGLSGLTATAGLAAANAGIQALRIVPLITGFVSGTTAIAENKDKALNYTNAANSIDEAIDAAERMVASRQDYTAAFEQLSQTVTKAKNELESSRVELATRDKQIEKLVDEKIKAKLPNQLRLADEDIDIPIGTTYALKVEDGGSVDPARTTISKPAIVDVSYSLNNQIISITGRAQGSTSIKFRDKTGISASVFVEVLGVTPLTSAQATPGGVVTLTLAEGRKMAYSLPDGVTGDGVTSSVPNVAVGRLSDDRKWIIIEAVKKQPTASASDITIGLKDKNGVMKFVVTVN